MQLQINLEKFSCFINSCAINSGLTVDKVVFQIAIIARVFILIVSNARQKTVRVNKHPQMDSL